MQYLWFYLFRGWSGSLHQQHHSARPLQPAGQIPSSAEMIDHQQFRILATLLTLLSISHYQGAWGHRPNPGLANDILGSGQNTVAKAFMIDIQFLAEVFGGHRIVLCAASDYFSKLLDMHRSRIHRGMLHWSNDLQYEASIAVESTMTYGASIAVESTWRGD